MYYVCVCMCLCLCVFLHRLTCWAQITIITIDGLYSVRIGGGGGVENCPRGEHRTGRNTGYAHKSVYAKMYVCGVCVCGVCGFTNATL